MSFSVGDYGKLYAGRSVNPQDILIGLKRFKANVFEQRAIYEDAKQQRKREEEYEQYKKDSIGYDEWKKLRGIEEGVLEKIKKHFEENKNEKK